MLRKVITITGELQPLDAILVLVPIFLSPHNKLVASFEVLLLSVRLLYHGAGCRDQEAGVSE